MSTRRGAVRSTRGAAGSMDDVAIPGSPTGVDPRPGAGERRRRNGRRTGPWNSLNAIVTRRRAIGRRCPNLLREQRWR